MQKSEVVDDETGDSVDSDVRTSTGTFLQTAQDDIVAAIERRVAQVSPQQQAAVTVFPASLFHSHPDSCTFTGVQESAACIAGTKTCPSSYPPEHVGPPCIAEGTAGLPWRSLSAAPARCPVGHAALLRSAHRAGQASGGGQRSPTAGSTALATVSLPRMRGSLSQFRRI